MFSYTDTERPDFDRAQNAATELLLRQNITGLFVDVRNFTFDRRIIIDTVQHYASVTHRPVSDFTCDEFSGCCVLRHLRCSVILYDNMEENEPRKHWGITHEVGHVYLNHENDGGINEIEAHFFAAQIVTPDIVLYEILKRKGSITTQDIASHFNASLSSAHKRINTLMRRQGWSSAERDKMLLKKFEPYIDQIVEAQKHNHCIYIVGERTV